MFTASLPEVHQCTSQPINHPTRNDASWLNPGCHDRATLDFPTGPITVAQITGNNQLKKRE